MKIFIIILKIIVIIFALLYNVPMKLDKKS